MLGEGISRNINCLKLRRLVKRYVCNAELNEADGILQLGFLVAIRIKDVDTNHGKVGHDVEGLRIVPLRAPIVVDGMRGVLEGIIHVNLHETVRFIT